MRTCQKCGKELDITHSGPCPYCKCENSNYKFISLCEVATAIENVKVEATEKDQKKWYKQMISRNKKSGDSKLVEGVHEDRDINRKDNKYDQVIIDKHTGEVIHEEHTSLTEHNTKKKGKKEKKLNVQYQYKY